MKSKIFSIPALIILLLLTSIHAKAQYVTIPDSMFATWLDWQYPGCMVGQQLDTTCNAVITEKNLSLDTGDWIDITGIQFFDSCTSLYMPLMFNLTFIPELPPLLEYIYSWGSTLVSSLPPTLPSTLRELMIWDNNISVMPPLPPGLTLLDCGSNNFTSFPPFPNTLQEIYCEDNPLTGLPALPSALTKLIAPRCGLTSLPPIPPLVFIVECQNNLLTNIPTLPFTMDYLNVSYNYGLQCLPAIPNVHTLFWDSTAITCLPNVFPLDTAYPAVTSVPLCDLFNTNNCGAFWNINGRVYTDVNTDCVIDTNETLLTNVKVNLYRDTVLEQQTFTNAQGEYSFDTDTGTYIYTIDSVLPINITCPPAHFYTITIDTINVLSYNNDISMECKPGFDVGVASVVGAAGNFRPGNNPVVQVVAGDMIALFDLHCISTLGGTVTVQMSGPVTFTSATPGALVPAVNGNTLTYTVADYSIVHSGDFNFIVHIDTFAQANQQVCFDVTVDPYVGDNDTTNNYYSHCFTIVNSFDPNDKQVSPTGSIDTSQHLLTYTIRFQNTGNAPAEDIYIIDTLDNAIDESSIQLLAYSHEPLVQVMGKIVRFNYPNINLPDSVNNEPSSHGYVQYRVKLNTNVPGTQIHNTAHIFFDFNQPVSTNTTFNQIDIFTSGPGITHEPSLVVYPNPVDAGNSITLNFNSSFAHNGRLQLYDVMGRLVFEKTILSSTQPQNIVMPLITRGLYDCVVNYENGTMHQMIMVK